MGIGMAGRVYDDFGPKAPFIAGSMGELVQTAPRDEEAILLQSFDLETLRIQRQSWGVFRDRRPDLYEPLLSLEGRVKQHSRISSGTK